jgi:tRNA threonylcarbamoyladenosine biosynthesis protein TsaE
MTIVLGTVERTRALGVELGSRLRAGDLIILSGSLGAGKTTLTKGIAEGMGVLGRVTSPTFVIARLHCPVQGAVPLVHVDAYRLSGTVELDDLDLDTDLAAAAVVIEWGEGVAEQLSDERLVIELERLPDDTRTATITPVGAAWESRFAEVAQALDAREAGSRVESPYGLQ